MQEIKNTNVAVIGGAGFLGSHLVDYLISERHCNVLVLDNLISGLRKHINPEATFEWFDIREDEEELIRILKKHEIRFVFNYAAEPYIPECFERPKHFFNSNAVAVLNVLNACQHAGIERVLQMSSAEIYGDMKGRIRETDPVTPHSTYGVSKLAADGLVQVRWREAKVPAIALRQFNCLGERETHEYVIPEIISQLAAQTGGEIKLGNNSSRDFLYAGDQVRMAVELLEKGELGEVYNLGSQDSVCIYDLAAMIARIMERPLTIKTDSARIRPWEIWHLQSDNSKIYSVISSRPTVNLSDALRRTIDYFYANGQKWDF